MFKTLQLFRIDRASSICSMIARKVGPFLPITKTARKNLEYIFGAEKDNDQIIDGLWDNFGRFIGEFPHIRTMPDEEINARVEIVGLENIEHFKKTNQPFFIFTGHFANWEIAVRVLGKFYHNLGAVYRRANNPYLENIIKLSRGASNINLIPKGPSGAKALLKSIKGKHSIAMLIDQKMNDGIRVPFCGKPAMTPHAIAKFALQFNYPIIPCQIIRKEGAHFKLIVHPPLEFKATQDSKKDCYDIMLRINQTLESWIRERPEQWLWFHNRWKKW